MIILPTRRAKDTEEISTIRKTICRGCKIYSRYKTCNFPPTIIIYEDPLKEYKCPCSTCLVKMVCITETSCSLMDKYQVMIGKLKKAHNG